MPTSHWSYPAIKDLAGKNIISGYGNGKFGFGDVATREQVAALIYRALLPNKQGGTFSNDGARYVLQDGSTLNNPYRDIRSGSTLFPEEVLTLTKLGIFNGDGNGGFRPKDSVSRAEMAQIIKNAFQVSAKQKHTFNDVPNGFGQKGQLVRCSQTGLHLVQATGNLNPLKR